MPIDAKDVWDAWTDAETAIEYAAKAGDDPFPDLSDAIIPLTAPATNRGANDDFADFGSHSIRVELEGAENSPERALVRATPFVWRDPKTIPMRPWIYGKQLLRGSVAAIIAPGGVGKTSFTIALALALATDRPLLGKPVIGGKKRVWLWNLEDTAREIEMGVYAGAIKWQLDKRDLNDNLFIDSAIDGAELKIAVEKRDGFEIARPLVEGLRHELIDRRIDVLIVDPFVSCHSVNENDNGSIDAVTKEWSRLAQSANCSIVLVHHTSKNGNGEITAESSRGASAMVNAARLVLALNRMTKDEADKFGVEHDEIQRHFRVDAVKSNRAPAGKADWFRIEGEPLDNGPDGGEWLPVTVPWTPPDAFAAISTSDLVRVQSAVANGEWRKSEQAVGWVGNAVAGALHLDLSKKSDRSKVKTFVKTWLDSGLLAVEMRPDDNRVSRPFVTAGKPVDV